MLDRRRDELEDVRASGLVRAALVAIITTVATLLGSRVVLLDPVRRSDEGAFDRIVPPLQEHEWLVSSSEILTDLGSKNLAYGAALMLAAVLLIVRRSVLASLLILATLVGVHGLQWLTYAATSGITPTEHVIGGAGPFYSGGVVRAMVVSGMFVAAFATAPVTLPLETLPLETPPLETPPLETPPLETLPSWRDRRSIWVLPLAVGLLEGGTRLVLGRHWPLDIALALPIGGAVLWCHWQVSCWIADTRAGLRS